jgi:hypothetical protein
MSSKSNNSGRHRLTGSFRILSMSKTPTPPAPRPLDRSHSERVQHPRAADRECEESLADSRDGDALQAESLRGLGDLAIDMRSELRCPDDANRVVRSARASPITHPLPSASFQELPRAEACDDN